MVFAIGKMFALQPYSVSLVMGVASGMPANPAWLPLLVDELPKGAKFVFKCFVSSRSRPAWLSDQN